MTKERKRPDIIRPRVSRLVSHSLPPVSFQKNRPRTEPSSLSGRPGAIVGRPYPQLVNPKAGRIEARHQWFLVTMAKEPARTQGTPSLL